MILNKKFDIRIHFWLWRGKNMANRSQLCNLEIWIKETLSLTNLKIPLLEYLTGLGLILLYIGVRLANLLDLDKYYDILDLDLKNTWTNLLDLDWFYDDQAGMLLEKYENLFQWSVKQSVIQSSLASSISICQTMCGVRKTKCC